MIGRWMVFMHSRERLHLINWSGGYIKVAGSILSRMKYFLVELRYGSESSSYCYMDEPIADNEPKMILWINVDI